MPRPSLLRSLLPALGLLAGGCTPNPSMEPAGDIVFEATIPELQAAMASGQVTSADLVTASLARIEAYDQQGPALNAMIHLDPDALERASEMDRERAAGQVRGPLHGIPVVIKDNYDVAGLPTTGGSIALAGNQPGRDAFQVARLREAGAVILGKTNLHELAYGITTISSAGGQTRNPYDPTRNPGGSSGGTGAAVAASFAAIGWGSDTCGSIRIPSAHNNLVGLRPTKGLSSIHGILPLASTQDVGGPLARTVFDLAIGLDAVIGADPADPATARIAEAERPNFVDSLEGATLTGRRIGLFLPLLGDEEEDREVAAVIRRAAGEMAANGATVVEVDLEGFADMLAGTSTIRSEFRRDLDAYLAEMPDPPVRSLAEIVEDGRFHPDVESRLRDGASVAWDEAAFGEILERRAAARERMVELFREQGVDALAYPSIRRVAAVIGEPAPGSNCQLSATTGMPALTVQAGFTDAGLPVGIELLGPPMTDAELLRIGYAYEQAVGHRRPPESTPALE